MSHKSDDNCVNELIEEVVSHLTATWPGLLQEWQADLKAMDRRERAVALVTRDCNECGTQVRVGAIMNPLSPNRPAGDRAYCAHCKKVTHSPVVAVHGLRITDTDEEAA